MRTSFILAIFGTALASAVPAAAGIPYLEAEASAGACGGSIGCSVTQDTIPPDPTNSTIATANEGNTLADGSYADGHAIVVFGHMHLSSDAFRATGSDAQASGQGWEHDEFPAATLMPGQQTATFAISGSFSPLGNVFGNYAYAYFNWDIYDDVTNQDVNGGYWESTDAVPAKTLTEPFYLPAGHGYYIHEYFEAATYSSYGVVDIADYHDTLDTYLATPGGGPVIGASGHDYAAPVAGGVPEPASWAMMVAGFGAVGWSTRQRHGRRPSAAAT